MLDFSLDPYSQVFSLGFFFYIDDDLKTIRLMEEIRWGIIGCGDVVEKKSGPAFQRIPNSKLVAVMRRDRRKAADFALRHQVPKYYDDAQSLIEDHEVNAIYVATPPSTHEAYAVAALRADKHLYLEKPMAMDTEGAMRIRKAAAESKGKLVIAHYRRALPAFKKVKNILNTGPIGDVLLADIRILQPVKSDLVATSDSNWRINPAISGGGLFHDLAPHHLDLMHHFFGDVENAFGHSLNKTRLSEADDIVTGLIKFKNGISFRGVWAFAVPAEEALDRCDILGTQGKISFSFFGNEVSLSTTKGKEIFTFHNPDYVQQPMIEEVIQYFLGHGDNPCSVNDGIKIMKIMDAFAGKII